MQSLVIHTRSISTDEEPDTIECDEHVGERIIRLGQRVTLSEEASQVLHFPLVKHRLDL